MKILQIKMTRLYDLAEKYEEMTEQNFADMMTERNKLTPPEFDVEIIKVRNL